MTNVSSNHPHPRRLFFFGFNSPHHISPKKKKKITPSGIYTYIYIYIYIYFLYFYILYIVCNSFNSYSIIILKIFAFFPRSLTSHDYFSHFFFYLILINIDEILLRIAKCLYPEQIFSISKRREGTGMGHNYLIPCNHIGKYAILCFVTHLAMPSFLPSLT